MHKCIYTSKIHQKVQYDTIIFIIIYYLSHETAHNIYIQKRKQETCYTNISLTLKN